MLKSTEEERFTVHRATDEGDKRRVLSVGILALIAKEGKSTRPELKFLSVHVQFDEAVRVVFYERSSFYRKTFVGLVEVLESLHIRDWSTFMKRFEFSSVMSILLPAPFVVRQPVGIACHTAEFRAFLHTKITHWVASEDIGN
jgi:hypothetical protein